MKKFLDIAKNNSGGTLSQDGILLDINKGFAVGVTRLMTDLYKAIYTLEEVLKLAKQDKDLLIGFWNDGLGNVYWDVVKVFEDKESAIETAKELNELAIWDFETKSEIKIN